MVIKKSNLIVFELFQTFQINVCIVIKHSVPFFSTKTTLINYENLLHLNLYTIISTLFNIILLGRYHMMSITDFKISNKRISERFTTPHNTFQTK